MALLRKLLAKQKADQEEAERKREVLLEKRRGYAKAARDRELARNNGLSDLPPLIALAINELPATEPAATPEPVQHDASSEELVARLTVIKERIFRLHAVFAVSLSHDAAMEANRFLVLFQDLAQQLKANDADALTALTRGHEAILNSPPIQIRQTIPLDTQRLCELRWEVSQAPIRRRPKRPVENVPDGLSWML